MNHTYNNARSLTDGKRMIDRMVADERRHQGPHANIHGPHLLPGRVFGAKVTVGTVTTYLTVTVLPPRRAAA